MTVKGTQVANDLPFNRDFPLPVYASVISCYIRLILRSNKPEITPLVVKLLVLSLLLRFGFSILQDL